MRPLQRFLLLSALAVGTGHLIAVTAWQRGQIKADAQEPALAGELQAQALIERHAVAASAQAVLVAAALLGAEGWVGLIGGLLLCEGMAGGWAASLLWSLGQAPQWWVLWPWAGPAQAWMVVAAHWAAAAAGVGIFWTLHAASRQPRRRRAKRARREEASDEGAENPRSSGNAA